MGCIGRRLSAHTFAVVVPPIPVPETDTEVVTLEVEVLAVLLAPADCAITLFAANIRPSTAHAAIN